jgi:hypothetical protein
VILGIIFIFFIACAASWIVYLTLRSNVGAKVESAINQEVGAFGMGGGLAAVGMVGFDVGKNANQLKKSEGGAEGGGMASKDHTHHQHNEFRAPLIARNEDPHVTPAASRVLDDLPKAVESDFDAVTDIVQCSTSKGNVTIDVRRKWSPKGAEQFFKVSSTRSLQ